MTDANLSRDELERLVSAGDIDTVIVGFSDMQGRLMGKRVSAAFFLDEVAEGGAECCNYLLAVDVDMNTVSGYAMSGWDSGYGDMVMRPDLTTLRRISWLPGTALVLADLAWHDGSPIEPAPRRVLRHQLDRLRERGLRAYVATELEFMVFDDTYRQAWANGYRGLTPASDYNMDYAVMASSRMEPLLRDIRQHMQEAALRWEAVKGECNRGQQELGFGYDEALITCDNHGIYKNGAKEIADQHGKSLTFMSKYDEREGNSCHIHMSLRSTEGAPVFADDDQPLGMSQVFRSFVAGQLATLRELTLLLRTEYQLLQAVCRPQLRAHRGGVGFGQPHLRTARGRPRRQLAGGMPGARGRRQPVSGGSGTDRGWAARYRTRTVASGTVRGQRLSAERERQRRSSRAIARYAGRSCEAFRRVSGRPAGVRG